ncbi:MAG: DUF4349 domain-containing protein [Fimbriimonadaceae bacterium]|nr:DUF4349 domain-containing protein [Fimbriimonadaceae bacterium]
MSVRDDLKAYLDGELAPERAAEVARAIETDPVLREEVEFMRALGFEIRRLAKDPGVEGLEGALSRAGRRRFLPNVPPLARWSFGGVAVILLVAVMFPILAQSKYSARLSGSADLKSLDSGATAAASIPMERESAKADLDLRYQGQAPDQTTFRDGGVEAKALRERVGGRGQAEVPATAAPVPADKESYSNIQGGEVPTLPTMVIRNANLELTVGDARAAMARATSLAQSLGGYVENSSINYLEGNLPVTNVTMRVPEKRFDTAMEQLRALGEVKGESVNGQDVTAQVVDLEARVKALKVEEDQYLTILSKASRIGDILQVKSRLGQVRLEIESLEGQRRYLRNAASMSTIVGTFTQRVQVGKPEAPKNWAEDTWAHAVNGLSAAGRWLGSVGIYVLVFAPIWLPLLVLGVVAMRRANKA